MNLVSQPGGCGALSSPLKFTYPSSPLSSKPKPKFVPQNPRKNRLHLSLASSDGGIESASAADHPLPFSSSFSSPPSPSPSRIGNDGEVTFAGQESAPLEGVIQFDKPNSFSRIKKWGRVGLLAGGDVFALLLFSAIGRFSHGLSVFDAEILRTADPFVAGWFLGSYFLGGYGEDGRGTNGFSKAVVAAVKSWSLGIPLGIIIQAATSGHIPPSNFIFVTMGSTGFLLIGWRALLSSMLSNGNSERNAMYRNGSPFELFELLTSLVRRW